jgi:hypothetical protein
MKTKNEKVNAIISFAKNLKIEKNGIQFIEIDNESNEIRREFVPVCSLAGILVIEAKTEHYEEIKTGIIELIQKLTMIEILPAEDNSQLQDFECTLVLPKTFTQSL